MKTLPLILIVLASSAVAGAVATSLTATPRAEEPQADVAAELAALSEAVAGMARRHDALAASLDQLKKTSALVRPEPERASVPDVDAAVARWMAEHPAGAGETREVALAEVSKEDRVAAALARLDEDLSDTEKQRLWRDFAAEGLTDDIVAAFEARAAASPNDPDMQVELGGIYLNKIFEVGNSPEAGMWATKADKAFDRALEIDETHWEARFSKAVSLSFWPPVFGKQGEAIKHFEILVGQQEGIGSEPGYAQTHLLLGNMYQQIGESEKAVGAWQRGLALFPDDEELRGQLVVFGAQAE